MRVLVIPEDFRNDQYILKPLFVQLFKKIRASRAKVRVCQDPPLRGVTEALKVSRIQGIVELYDGTTDIFVLCVDRDGKEGRRERLDQLEQEFGVAGRVFLAENAWEECETWALAGLILPPEWKWSEIRAEVDVKERYFDRLAVIREVERSEGGGRKILGAEAARNLKAIRQKCPEDFDALARRLELEIKDL